jgi:hypothetical protein
MKKRIFSIIVAVALVITSMPAVFVSAYLDYCDCPAADQDIEWEDWGLTGGEVEFCTRVGFCNNCSRETFPDICAFHNERLTFSRGCIAVCNSCGVTHTRSVVLWRDGCGQCGFCCNSCTEDCTDCVIVWERWRSGENEDGDLFCYRSGKCSTCDATHFERNNLADCGECSVCDLLGKCDCTEDNILCPLCHNCGEYCDCKCNFCNNCVAIIWDSWEIKAGEPNICSRDGFCLDCDKVFKQICADNSASHVVGACIEWEGKGIKCSHCACVSAGSRVRGDVNDDGAVTIIDALEILMFLAGLPSELDNPDNYDAARDITGGAVPSISDALEILMHLAGMDSAI